MTNVKTSELLLWFSRVESKPETAEIDFSSLSAKDWCNFLQQVKYHRLFTVVMSKLNECATLQVPESVVEVVESEIYNHKKRLLKLNFELVKVANILESEGIETIFYKGPTLSLLAYDSLEGRMFDDLDIWVKSDDYLRPKAALRKHGYLSLEYPLLSTDEEDEFRHYAGEYALAKSDSTICIDVHHRILGGGFIGSKKRLEHSRSRCIYVQISGKSIKTLCPEDLLIFLCLNGLKDGWESFRIFCDIDRLVRNFPSMNWDIVCDESKYQSVSRAVGIGLLVSNRALGTPISDKVFTSLISNHKVQAVASAVQSHILKQINGKTGKIRQLSTLWLILSALDNSNERIEYVTGVMARSWRLLVTVNSQDLNVLKLPKSFFWLYYIVRFFRVLLIYRLGIVKTLLK